jgi:hypothetical protein
VHGPRFHRKSGDGRLVIITLNFGHPNPAAKINSFARYSILPSGAIDE